MEERLQKVESIVKEVVELTADQRDIAITYKVYISPNVKTNIHVDFTTIGGQHIHRIICPKKVDLDTFKISIINLLVKR